MIEGIRIESEEDGWHLELDGDLVEEAETYLGSETTTLRLHLSQDAALELCRQILPVQEWRAEGEQVRREFEQHLRAGGDDVDDPDHPDPELAREGADLARKAERERS